MHIAIQVKLVYAEGKKPKTKDNIVHYFIYIEFQNYSKLSLLNRKEEINSAQILESGEIDCKRALFGKYKYWYLD